MRGGATRASFGRWVTPLTATRHLWSLTAFQMGTESACETAGCSWQSRPWRVLCLKKRRGQVRGNFCCTWSRRSSWMRLVGKMWLVYPLSHTSSLHLPDFFAPTWPLPFFPKLTVPTVASSSSPSSIKLATFGSPVLIHLYPHGKPQQPTH